MSAPGQTRDEPALRPHARSPLATATEVASEPTAFPRPTAEAPHETPYPDWRRRLARNLARRSDGRWEPLTRTHAALREPERR